MLIYIVKKKNTGVGDSNKKKDKSENKNKKKKQNMRNRKKGTGDGGQNTNDRNLQHSLSEFIELAETGLTHIVVLVGNSIHPYKMLGV
jgi:transcription initiation factor TFIIIB Brf1 subunit/transcription initiation factor TFIIB